MKNFLFIIIIPFMLMALHQSLNNKPSEIMIKKDAKKLAEYYRQRVIKGESMASLATLYSEDPGSASNGGQYKNVTKGMFVPKFETVAFNLKPNEISEVFETQFGFHFIQLISRKNDVLDLRHLLITKD